MKTILVLTLGFLFFGKEGLNFHVVLGMMLAVIGMIWYGNASSKPGGKERQVYSVPSEKTQKSSQSELDQKVWNKVVSLFLQLHCLASIEKTTIWFILFFSGKFKDVSVQLKFIADKQNMAGTKRDDNLICNIPLSNCIYDGKIFSAVMFRLLTAYIKSIGLHFDISYSSLAWQYQCIMLWHVESVEKWLSNTGPFHVYRLQ